MNKRQNVLTFNYCRRHPYLQDSLHSVLTPSSSADPSCPLKCTECFVLTPIYGSLEFTEKDRRAQMGKRVRRTWMLPGSGDTSILCGKTSCEKKKNTNKPTTNRHSTAIHSLCYTLIMLLK